MYRFLLLFIALLSITFSFSQENNEVIMIIGGDPVLKEEFVSLYTKNNDCDPEKKTPQEYLELFVNFKLKVLEAEQLEYDTIPGFINKLDACRERLSKPNFGYMMKEYHDSILLFSISEDKIWKTAAKDSVGLRTFYKKNKKNYLWEARFKGWVIKCRNQEVKDFIEAVFEADPLIEAQELKDQLSLHFDKSEDEINYGYFEKGLDPLVDYFVWHAARPKDFNDELHFIRGDKAGPMPKTLEEAKGLCLSDYQDFLEKKWLRELRHKYKIKVNKRVLKSIEPVQ